MTFNPGTEHGTVRHSLAHFYQKVDNNVPDLCHVCRGLAQVWHSDLLCKIASVPGVPCVPYLHLTSLRCSKNGLFSSKTLHLNKRYGSDGTHGTPGTGGNVKKLEGYRTNEKRLSNGGKTAAK